MFGLANLLHRESALADAGRDGFFDVPKDYCSPGFWAAYVARARARELRLEDLAIPPGDILGYARALGIERALGQNDTYPHERRGAGANYSPLVLLESPEETDHATHEINCCIRQLFDEPEFSVFVSRMCELVGDLLDNVWSHGKSTGVSMAQKWKSDDGFCFELAVADCGLGFLRELRRVGIPGIANDADAIAWCVEKGHSTKKKTVHDWAQRLPADMIGNPMPGIGHVVESDNHHLGLGLAKLVENVERFEGWLWLASGTSILVIRPGRDRVIQDIRVPWPGVALACRFDSTHVAGRTAAEPADEFEDILSQLLRGQP